MSKSSLFWGSILTLLGILLLLDNFGFLGNISVWVLIGPIILIGLGVWILVSSTRRISTELVQEDVKLGASQKAKIKINYGAGRFTLEDGAPPGLLLKGNFYGGVDKKETGKGDVQEIELSIPTRNFPMSWFPGEKLDWSLWLSNELPIELEINSGAGDMNLDLSRLNIVKLKYKTGASSNHIVVPAVTRLTEIKIESGVASVVIEIPEGVAARVSSKSGLSSINVERKRFPKSGDYYISPDWEIAENKVDIKIEMGVGSVDVR